MDGNCHDGGVLANLSLMEDMTMSLELAWMTGTSLGALHSLERTGQSPPDTLVKWSGHSAWWMNWKTYSRSGDSPSAQMVPSEVMSRCCAGKNPEAPLCLRGPGSHSAQEPARQFTYTGDHPARRHATAFRPFPAHAVMVVRHQSLAQSIR